jgi:chromosome segregation ATPase
VSFESKVEKLEAKIASMSSTEKELRKELASLLDSEKSNDNSVCPMKTMLVLRLFKLDKEKRQLQAAVKAAKSELATKVQELSDAQEELSDQQASSKEREKALKQKLKEVTLEKDRLAGLEVSQIDLS